MLRLVVFVGVVIVYGSVWIWYRKKENKLTQYTKDLRDNPCEETLRRYIRYLRWTKIPDEPQFWGVLRDAYEVVLNQPDKFNPETIEQFKQSLRRKGVRWVQ
ncbi:MAG: hypothetical protein K6T81_14340 [Alicyclobacillus macrosporangiidus]|uniref:hypothetical protein n=1 Tax=Alicyclobacillus macrosporangiidus TaxID=392015 RepID=UPI0026F0FAEC|nr:hypothetical protein [Alicyclobacillus macrosporangiidus]MCL6599895.1 hypothetical protein [Alicyclobacillus macrosporangiidus]